MSKTTLTVSRGFLLDRSTTGALASEPSSLNGTVRGGTVEGGSLQSTAPVYIGPVAKTSQRNPKRRPRSVLRHILNSAT